MTRANRQHEARGFTLMELMVVMGIIVLMLSMGVLAFSTLTGRRSISMAQNQVAGMLGRARALAVNDPDTTVPAAYGVCFFLDQQTDRSAMALIRVTALNDTQQNSKAWTENVYYYPGDQVLAIVRDTFEGNRPQARLFRCKQPHQSHSFPLPQSNRPPRYPGEDPNYTESYPMQNLWWVEVQSAGASTVNDDIELLPVGVGVQTANDVTAVDTANGLVYDRYLRTGVILFDKQGRLEHLDYRITGDTTLGQRIGLAPAGSIGGSNATYTYTLYSQLGVVLYDTEMFRNQSGFTEGDRSPLVQIPGLAAPTPAANEVPEENWIDANGTLLLVNRYSGELLRAR